MEAVENIIATPDAQRGKLLKILGVVLYKMLAGQLPFAGKTAMELSARCFVFLQSKSALS